MRERKSSMPESMIEISDTYGRARADTVMSTTWDPSGADDNSLLNPRPRKGRCTNAARCTSGVIGGAACGVIAVYVLIGYTLLFPSTIHHAIATALFPCLGALLGGLAAAISRAPCVGRYSPRVCKHRSCRSEALHGAVAAFALVAAILLVAPTNTQADMWQAAWILIGNFVDTGPPPLPPGYCADAAANAATAASATQPWWLQWGASVDEAASRLRDEMST